MTQEATAGPQPDFIRDDDPRVRYARDAELVYGEGTPTEETMSAFDRIVDTSGSIFENARMRLRVVQSMGQEIIDRAADSDLVDRIRAKIESIRDSGS